jgi:hypothetical protein
MGTAQFDDTTRIESLDLAEERLFELKHGIRNAPLRKTLVTRHELRGVFVRIFDKRRSRLGGAQCCSVPLPFHSIPAVRGAPNWQIRAPVKCPRGCDFVLRGIQKELRSTYDLVPPLEKSRTFSGVVLGLAGLSAFAYYMAWVAR